ncbi:PAS domain-containing protein, partial [Planomicrobium okeanokoites]
MNDKSQPGTEKMPESPLSDSSDQFHFEDSIFEYIVQKVPVSLYIMSQTNFIYVNDCLCEMLDYPEEDFLSGKLGLTDIIHPEDLPKVRKRFFHLSKGTTQKARYRVRVIKRDGSLLHAEIHSTTSSLDGKQVFLGSVSDITEEVLANDRLKDSEERFNSLFYENPDAIFSFDLEGNFIDVNPGSLKLSGYSHQELMEMAFMPMI